MTPKKIPGAADFPYHWDSDERVARRELLGFAVYTSGTLFAGTAALAALGAAKGPASYPRKAIGKLSELAEGQALYVHYPEEDDEAVVLRLHGGRLVGYSQRCTHLSCAVVHQPDRQRFYCPCHDGAFDVETGEPVAGPPTRRLPRIELVVEGDVVTAVGIRP